MTDFVDEFGLKVISLPDGEYVLVRKDDLRSLMAEVIMTVRLTAVLEATREERVAAPLVRYAKAMRLLREALHPEIRR